MNFVEKSDFGVKYWQIDSWVKQGFVHGFVGKDINLKHSSKEASDFLQKLLGPINLELKLFKQIHSDICIECSDYNLKQSFEADAWLSKFGKGNFFLGIKTADCFPVIVFSPDTGLAANLHCGWRGTVSGLLIKTIKRLIDLGSIVENIEIAIGPGAGVCCYEVGEEVIEIVKKLDYLKGNIEEVLQENKNNICCNIERILEIQALSLGVKKLCSSSLCTICNKDFFSYRREKDISGRQFSFFQSAF